VGIRLLPALLAANGETERSLAEGGGIIRPAGQEKRLGPPPRPQGLAPGHRQALCLPHTLFEKRQGLGHGPGEGVRIAKVRGCGEHQNGELARATQFDSLLQDRDGGLKVASAKVNETGGEQCVRQPEPVREGLADLSDLLGSGEPLGEVSQLDEGPSQPLGRFDVRR
jgi:hypothetical protein